MSGAASGPSHVPTSADTLAAAQQGEALTAWLAESRAWIEAALIQALAGESNPAASVVSATQSARVAEQLGGLLPVAAERFDGLLPLAAERLAGLPPLAAERLAGLLPLAAERLDGALRYAVLGGGKRIRPTLVRLACAAHGGSDAAAAPAAVAVELIHAYSLVHDDLPCMDDDALRRGRPTVHVVYGEALAVLVGDGLQAVAFEHLARHGGPRAAEAVALLAGAAGPRGMVRGQALDLAAEGQRIDASEAESIHRAKTAALLGASAELGALAAGAGIAARAACRHFGVELGLLFQAVDDLLDVTGDAATLGKTPGKDDAGAKGTVVRALGLDGARQAAEALAERARAAGHRAGLDAPCAGGNARVGGLASALVARLLGRRS